MGDDNQKDGFECFQFGTPDTRAWFTKQWEQWPTRVDPRNTINLSFLYGGLQAYREEYKQDPKLSESFRGNIKFLEPRDGADAAAKVSREE